MPSLCGSAEATHEWFRAFTAHSFLACRPLRPRGVRHRYFPELRCRHWPSPNDHRLGTPNTPAIRSTRAVDFVASPVRFRYSLPGCLPPCTDQTGILAQPPGTFTSRLSTDRSPSPLLDITTTATGLLCWRDSHPLEWQLASLHGHFRLIQPVLPAGPCPLRFESDRNAAWPRNDVNGMDRPRSRPRRHAECAGGLSGEGALPCFAQPPFTQ